jgi:hypothetical protein
MLQQLHHIELGAQAPTQLAWQVMPVFVLSLVAPSAAGQSMPAPALEMLWV